MVDLVGIPNPTGSLRVLAVDDNSGDLELLKYYLTEVEGLAFEFVSTNEHDEAARLLSSGAFDLAFIDYRLNSQTGIELLTALRAEGHEVPAILMTGQGDEVLVTRAINAGFADYMPKSAVCESSLKRAIGNVLEKEELRQQTERYRADLEATVRNLEDRNREISSFYYTLAHELKTPLTAAREYAALVHDGIAGDVNPQQMEFLRTTIQSCDQLTRCIEDLFDVSRIETGKFQVELETAELTKLVEECVEQKQQAARDADIELVLHPLPELPPLALDPQRIRQVVSNLLGNAIKFSPTGSRVEVHCEAGPDSQVLTVADNGPGIPAEDLEMIFERLYQGTGHATVTGGMGLGLHISRELVRLHGGRIEVESTFGDGARFNVRLPARAA